MHPYKRAVRVNDLLREEIALIVMRRIKDPRVGFLTVTGVEVTEDLKIARVFISVLDREHREETLSVLNAASGFIRSELSKKVKMKFIPQLEFHIDSSIDYGDRIDTLLRKIKEEK
ncbi:MAG: 30S ribosome-binding factor RbfA [Thermodesulfovibrionales bacterium]